jgi:hypothetical protein
MTRDELQRVIGITNNKYFRLKYLKPALEAGYIEMTIPTKPNSKNQKYKKKLNLLIIRPSASSSR